MDILVIDDYGYNTQSELIDMEELRQRIRDSGGEIITYNSPFMDDPFYEE